MALAATHLIGFGGTTGGVEPTAPVVRDGIDFADDNESMSRTPGTFTSTKKCAISFWFEYDGVNADTNIIFLLADSLFEKYLTVALTNDATDTLNVGTQLGGVGVDLSAFSTGTKYNILILVDTTQATASDRLKVYYGTYGGASEIAEATYLNDSRSSITQNSDFTGNGGSFDIGGNSSNFGGTQGANATIGDFYYLDGNHPAATTTFAAVQGGELKPVDSPSVTYGSQGCYLNFTDVGNDTSGNNNDFTGNGVDSSDHVDGWLTL